MSMRRRSRSPRNAARGSRTCGYRCTTSGSHSSAACRTPADSTSPVAWLVLPYLPDRRTVLANLAATLRPGGVLLLGNVPDEALRLDHPAAADLMAAGRQLVERMGLGGLQDSLTPMLDEAGLEAVTTQQLRYPMGGATSAGHRWYAYMLTSMSTAKPIIVDMFGLMDQAEYDRRFDQLATESVLDLSGEVRFLVTLARHP